MAQEKETKPKEEVIKKATPKKKTTPKKAEPKVVEQETTNLGFFKKMLSGENKALFIGINALFIAVVVIVLIFVFSGGTGNGVILARMDSDYDTDLFYAVYGKENKEPVRIMKNIDTYTGSSYLLMANEGEYLGSISGAQFIPELGKIIFFYQDGDDIMIEQMKIGKDETEELFQTENSMSGILFIDEGRLLIEDYDSDDLCYVSELKDEAERVVKADSCSIQGPDNFIVRDSDDLIIYDINKEEEIELLEDIDEVARYRISDDFSTVAYVIEDDGEYQLFMLDKKGDEIELSEEIDYISRVYFQPDSNDDGLFIGIDKDDPGIYRFGEENAIIEEDYLSYSFVEDGKYAIILAGNDYDDIALYSYNMSKDDLVEIYSGEVVRFGFIPDQELLYIKEIDNEDTVIFTSDFNGNNLVKIYDDNANTGDTYVIPGIDKLFIEMIDDEEISLLVNSLDEEEHYALIDEWYAFEILNYSPDGKHIVFQGREDDGDDLALFVVEIKEDAEIIELYELDEDFYRFYNAVFSANGKYVVFSAPTGDDADEKSVFEVRITGNDDAEEIFEEAILSDVEWGNLRFFPYDFYTYSATEY